MSDQLIDDIAAVEAGYKSRKWFEENYLEDGVLYVTHAQYRAILKANDDAPLWRNAPYDMAPRPDSIQVVIRDR
jgi:hypothetical protein